MNRLGANLSTVQLTAIAFLIVTVTGWETRYDTIRDIVIVVN